MKLTSNTSNYLHIVVSKETKNRDTLELRERQCGGKFLVWDNNTIQRKDPALNHRPSDRWLEVLRRGTLVLDSTQPHKYYYMLKPLSLNKGFCIVYIVVASDHAGTKVKNSCKSCRLKWIQTSLILILLCFSWMIMTSKQRKMQIKLVWNHFVLKFILTYNIPVYIHNWEQANLLSSSSFHLYFRNSQHFHSM